MDSATPTNCTTFTDDIFLSLLWLLLSDVPFDEDEDKGVAAG